MQYELMRGTNDKHVHVLCYADQFYSDDVPDHVRKRGPWQQLEFGDVETLLPEMRL